MFQNLWMQKTPHGFLRRLRSMLRHLAVVNGPLGYNLVAGFSDGLWMVASSDFWISKSSDDPKVSNEWSIMVYVKSIYFLPDFFFRSSLFGAFKLSFSPTLRHHNCKRQLFVEAERRRKGLLRKPTCLRLAEMSTHMWEYMPWNAVGISRSKVGF